jgi:hypothetical protein
VAKSRIGFVHQKGRTKGGASATFSMLDGGKQRKEDDENAETGTDGQHLGAYI